MKTKLTVILSASIGLFAVSTTILAHHGGAVYLTQNPKTLKGTVTEFTQ